ncbi:MAG: hypothetical protein D3922_04150 [Candidatus Electrothrix sp. AR1]|nr:hypothetical protein [Candidatus Electrothrix sp. AR1]
MQFPLKPGQSIGYKAGVMIDNFSGQNGIACPICINQQSADKSQRGGKNEKFKQDVFNMFLFCFFGGPCCSLLSSCYGLLHLQRKQGGFVHLMAQQIPLTAVNLG